MLLSLHLLLDDRDGVISQWVTQLGNGPLKSYFHHIYGWEKERIIDPYYISWYIFIFSLYSFMVIAFYNLYLKIKWENILDKLAVLLLTIYFVKDLIVYLINGNDGFLPNFVDWTFIAVMFLLVMWRNAKWSNAHKNNIEIDFKDDKHIYLAFRGVYNIKELIQAFWGMAFGCVKPIAGGYVYYFNRRDNEYVKKPINKPLPGHIAVKLKISPDEFIKHHDKHIGAKMSNRINCASVLDTLKIFGYKTSIFPSVLAFYFIKKQATQ